MKDQMKSSLNHLAPDTPVINLMHDVPHHNVQAGSYLLGALFEDCLPNSVIVAIVDPGVGSNQREPMVLKVGDRWVVRPGNGLVTNVVHRTEISKTSVITWSPERLSASFHGREIFEDEDNKISNVTLTRVSTFGDVSPGSAMRYENSLGLAEIAINQGRANQEFSLSIGSSVSTVNSKS
tara:strand:+ start:126 stop:665 length:540 start_codon:yes stop_codon:yes gene_type:complete